MSSKRIADLPVKNPIDAMKLPTGGFGDYAITLKTLSDWLVNKYSLATKEELKLVEDTLKDLIENKADKDSVYTKQEVDTIVQKASEKLEQSIQLTNTKVDSLETTVESNYQTLIQGKADKNNVVFSIGGQKGDVTYQQIKDGLALKDVDVTTWSGLKQDTKNKENLSAQDYGAVGDGVTDDTQSFSNLESDYNNRIVDLLGKTYLVSSVPSGKNYYINGYFKIGNSLITAKGNFKIHSDTTVSPFSLDIAGELWSTRAQMVRYTAGASSVVQSIAVDEVNRYFYSLTASTPKLICRYDYDKKLYNQSIDQNNDTNGVLGHQGLAVEQLGSGDTLLWTSSDTAPNTGSSAHTFRYKPLADGAITLEEDWTLFPKDGVSQSITPNISVDQRYLLVMRQFTASDGAGVHVRVFYMKDVKEARKKGNFDLSEKYISEFKYQDIGSPTEVSRQDIACDGHYIYIMWGTWRIDTEDYILKFDLRGNLVQRYDAHHIGLQNSIDGGTEGQHEPEGLCFVTSPKGGYTLLLQVAFGDTGGRKCWVYELGGEQPLQSYTDNVPSVLLNSNSGLEICSPTDMPLRFGNYSNSAGLKKNLTIDSTGRLLKGLDNSMSIGGTTNGFQWHATSTQSNAVFGRWASGSSQYPQLMLFKSSGTNVGDSVANPSGSVLGSVSFFTDVGAGTGADNGVLSASISSSTTGVPVNGNSPSRLNFSTTSSTGNYTSRWTMDSNGDWLPNLTNNYNIGGSANRVKKVFTNSINIGAVPTYSDNATATIGGLVAGDVYKTSTGQLMIVF